MFSEDEVSEALKGFRRVFQKLQVQKLVFRSFRFRSSCSDAVFRSPEKSGSDKVSGAAKVLIRLESVN
jgi:hypothetical protein